MPVHYRPQCHKDERALFIIGTTFTQHFMVEKRAKIWAFHLGDVFHVSHLMEGIILHWFFF